MYKITLFDNNMPSCTSGVFSVFCDDIDEFEREWDKLNRDEEQKARFLASKNGEIMTDYYNDSPDLNIVQKDDNTKILLERKLEIKEKKVTVYNGYRCPSDIYFDKAILDIRYICFNKVYYKIVKYKLFGGRREWIDGKFHELTNYGNELLKMELNSNRSQDFSKDTIESIVYYPVLTIDKEKIKDIIDEEKMKLSELTNEEWNMLLCDIVGEAG